MVKLGIPSFAQWGFFPIAVFKKKMKNLPRSLAPDGHVPRMHERVRNVLILAVYSSGKRAGALTTQCQSFKWCSTIYRKEGLHPLLHDDADRPWKPLTRVSAITSKSKMLTLTIWLLAGNVFVSWFSRDNEKPLKYIIFPVMLDFPHFNDSTKTWFRMQKCPPSIGPLLPRKLLNNEIFKSPFCTA